VLRCAVLYRRLCVLSCHLWSRPSILHTRGGSPDEYAPAHACLPACLRVGIWDIRVVPLTMNENTTASCCIVLWRNSLTHYLSARKCIMHPPQGNQSG
jgi:hypothetical protein